MGFFSKRLKNEYETAMVHEPSVFKPLKFYCIQENNSDNYPEKDKIVYNGISIGRPGIAGNNLLWVNQVQDLAFADHSLSTIIFLISQRKHMLRPLIKPVSMRQF